MSLTGTVIDRPDHPLIPHGLRTRGSRARVNAWIAAHNERYQVVGYCQHCTLPDGQPRPLIAEEAVAHRLQHLPDGARKLAGRFEQATLEERAAFRAYIAEYHA